MTFLFELLNKLSLKLNFFLQFVQFLLVILALELKFLFKNIVFRLFPIFLLLSLLFKHKKLGSHLLVFKFQLLNLFAHFFTHFL